MKINLSPMLFASLFFTIFMEISHSHCLAPALYVFGDSTLDAGNVNTTRTVSALPYGVDFPVNGSRRLTNGYTMADFLGEWLGLGQLPPTIMELFNNKIKNNVTHGFNYALSGAGIINETLSVSGGARITPANVGQQVQQFRRTVEEYLPTQFTTIQALSDHLSASIFLVAAGGNDYLLRYLPNFKSPGAPNATEFADKLGIYLQELYNLGARKIVVNEIGPIGNIPVSKIGSTASSGEEELNGLALIYNDRLTSKLRQLNSSLPSSTFVHLKTFDLALDLIRNPSKYGVKNSECPCCKINMNGGCELNTVPCSNRTEYVFFDAIHPSEITNKIILLQCFNGTTGICVPNIKELTQINSKDTH